jgi:hypothetical protein
MPNIVSLPCRLRAQSVLEQKGRQGLTLAGPIILLGHRLRESDASKRLLGSNRRVKLDEAVDVRAGFGRQFDSDTNRFHPLHDPAVEYRD